MSAKWRALQHRHRYTYSAVIFPQYYKDSLNSLDTDTLSCNYYTQLTQLIILNSTYAQVNHVKKLALAFTDVLKNDGYGDNFVYSAAKFYLGILFLENSVPLHKTLVSVLAKTRDFKGLIGKCFRELCEEYGGENGNGKGKRFCISRVALSMMSTPKLGYLVEIVEECAILVGLDVVFGLNGVISETRDWSRPSPIVMEQCQDALSCIYYLLQRCPLTFSNLNGIKNGSVSRNSNVLERVLTTILNILKSEAFSRDCFVAAGVSFCSALQVCLPPEELGFAIIEGIFYQATVRDPDSNFSDLVLKIPYNGDLFRDIRNLSVLSRLCLVRGILTAIPRTVLNMPFVVRIDGAPCSQDRVDSIMSIQTILYDRILPELCNYCENPTDSHSNFHALTVLQICLQQIKTSIQANLGNTDTENNTPISDDMGARMLRIIWNNLEDPLSQTVKQVHLIFDIFLDIQSSLPSAECIGRTNLFLEKIASNLLRMGPRCKGRYIPLASLTKRLGSKAVLGMSPDLMFEIMWAYIDDDVCCAATTFLKCFLERLRDECWSSDGVENGYRQYRSLCLWPFMCGLASGNSKLRSNLNTYALPVLLEVDVDSIFPMLAFISVVPDGEYPDLASSDLDGEYVALRVEQKVAVLVSLLKVSRSLALIEGDVDWYKDISLSKEEMGQQAERMGSYALVSVKGIKVKILVKWLVLALTHIDDLLRIDAAESLFLNPKTSSLPSSLELSVMKEAMPLNMRCSSTAFQMKFTSLFRKFFARVRTALERQVKQGKWQPLAFKNNGLPPCKEKEEPVLNRAEDLFCFMKWLSSFLFFSCYPSAPYERKIMAMDLILTMNNAWSIIPPLHEKHDSASEIVLNPYCEGLTSPESTLLLVGSIVDSWDHLRESSFRILLHFPNPLPGISTPDMVLKVITWAKKLVCSPRVRESDAGALTLRLIFRKYVWELGWIVNVSCGAVSLHTQPTLANGDYEASKRRTPVIEYVSSLIDWLQVVVELGEKDLSDACRNSFVHGVLLALRYTFEELDWDSDLVISEMKHALEKLLELVSRITTLALWVVSANAWHLPEDIDDVVNDDAFLLEAPDGMDASMSASGPDVKDSVHDVGPSDQIVMVGCWLAMKEVSLLLGTIIRKTPLSSSDIPVESCLCLDTADTPSRTSEVLLDLKQLETIGNHFLEVLLKVKHNGAIDKTRAGFTALCNRLLCSNDPRLGKLTESWMEQLMERTVATGQTVDDLLRRSAGIPAAFSAFFLSEPEGTPKRLLPKALRWLIDVAKRSVIDQAQKNISDKDFSEGFSTKSNQAILHKQESEIDGSERISKFRDEGVIPTVHAFNVLRAAFNDSNLATDTSGFSAEALIISIRSFSSSYWEVRNSACLAYTALVRRMIGFLNVQKRESARRALTGLEFFHRYPSLHPFLFDELRIATEFLSDGLSGHIESSLANIVHPSLCPMLILLSRLKPSAITRETGDLLDPFLFMPFIRKCSTQSNLRVRVLASRALAGLISNEKLPAVLLNIVAELPCTENQITGAKRFNMIHGLLLQLSSLLDTNFRNIADLSKKELILDDLIQVIGMRSWIGSPRLCPCPIVNSCFLRVLDIMLSIARTSHMSKCINAIWKLLWVLSSECLDVEAHGSSFYDPTIAELRKQAATSYFNCLFQTSKEVDKEEIPMSWARTLLTSNSLDEESIVTGDALSRFQERLVRSMSDASYEVRIASLKWLFLFLKAMKSGGQSSCKSSSIISWTNTNLQVELVDLLTLEKNPKCTYYILKILFTWNELNFQKLGDKHCPETRFVGNMDEEPLFHFWDKLVLLYKSTRHAKTLEILLCCMGVCAKRFSDLFMSSVSQQRERTDKVYGCISYYVSLIELHADSSEPGNVRKAAAESMVASGLLKQAELVGPSVLDISQVSSENLCSDFEENDIMNMYARKILDVWSTCIKLLEDEDVNIRNRLAVEVQKCFGPEDSGKRSQIGLVPSQVDKVINLSFEHLSSVFSHWIDFFDYLARWVLSISNNVISRGDLVRRVFDKETDNHHEEKLLICQICCFHLQKLPMSKCWGGECEATKFSLGTRMKSFLLEWRLKFLQRLISFAGDVAKQEGVDWIGGLGNHKDAFLPLYSNLLGIYATSKCIFQREYQNSNYLLSDVVALSDIINPFLGNPLICALYVLVVELHEESVEAADGNLDKKKPRRSALVWEGFDPYFLLR